MSVCTVEEMFDEPPASEEEQPSDAKQTPSARIELKPFQLKAVEMCVARYSRKGNMKPQLLYGRTASGKTVTAVEIINRVLKQDMQTNPTPEIVLIVVPSVGGNLPPHWERELLRQGIDADRIVRFDSPYFRGKTEAWWKSCRSKLPFTDCDKPLFVITTFHTLHYSVSKFGMSSIYMDLKFTHMIVDECQFFRNGSHRLKEEDIDPDKVMFGSITSVQRKHNCRVLATSATPYYSAKTDVYSLAVLMHVASNKQAWQQDATKDQWKAARDWFWNNYVVPIIVPDEFARQCDVVHHPVIISQLSNTESKLAMDANERLNRLVKILLSEMEKIKGLNGPARIAQITIADAAMKNMVAQLTRCRRGVQHPAFYDPPIRKIVRGKEVILPVPIERFYDFKLEECARFASVVRVLKSLKGRVLVTSHFSRPLDFLKLYIEKSLDDWAVVVHHGGTNCVKAMKNFDDLGETKNVVMLATAGSIGEGVNLSMTTNEGSEAVQLICLDYPLTNAAQEQLEGRIKRPLAQPNVNKWHVRRVESIANMPRPPNYTLPWNSFRTTVDQALKQVLEMKKSSSEEIFASDEEIANLAERAGQSNYGSKALQEKNSLLVALLQVGDSCNDLEDCAPNHKMQVTSRPTK